MFLENRGNVMIRFSSCGHMGYQHFDITPWGTDADRITFDVDDKNIREEDGVLVTDKTCGQCILEDLQKCCIRCCFCGRGIIPGDLVCLYPAKENKSSIRFEPTYLDNDVVVCCKDNCGGPPVAGYWLGKKENGQFLLKYIF